MNLKSWSETGILPVATSSWCMVTKSSGKSAMEKTELKFVGNKTHNFVDLGIWAWPACGNLQRAES